MPFPKDTMAAKCAFYGDPRGPYGVNEKWLQANVIRVVPPFQMNYAGKPIKSISFHKKAAPALSAALQSIWAACGKDQKKVDAAGLSEGKMPKFGAAFFLRHRPPAPRASEIHARDVFTPDQ